VHHYHHRNQASSHFMVSQSNAPTAPAASTAPAPTI